MGDVCAICLSGLVSDIGVVVPCGHCFHVSCFNELVHHHRTKNKSRGVEHGSDELSRTATMPTSSSNWEKKDRDTLPRCPSCMSPSVMFQRLFLNFSVPPPQEKKQEYQPQNQVNPVKPSSVQDRQNSEQGSDETHDISSHRGEALGLRTSSNSRSRDNSNSEKISTQNEDNEIDNCFFNNIAMLQRNTAIMQHNTSRIQSSIFDMIERHDQYSLAKMAMCRPPTRGKKRRRSSGSLDNIRLYSQSNSGTEANYSGH
jgi:hypothetical protein